MPLPRLGTLAFASALTIVASPALSQTTWVKIPDSVQLAPWGTTVDGAEDWDVMGANGQKIGEIEEIIGTDQATATAAVVDFEDGAGFGDGDDVVVPLDRFTVSGNVLTLNADAAAVAAFQQWND